MYPLSKRIPSTKSSSIPKVWDSSTVTTPSLPTFSRASAMVSPISGSAAEMAATWAISPLPSTSRACFWMASTVTATACSMPRFRAMGLAPAATLRIPWWTMARARTVAVVVPSPATSLVLVATSLASWAPMFSQGSSSSTSLAMVTPSLVMVGAPHFLSSTTFRPFGPRVMDTASASLLTPVSKARRASSSNFSCLAGMTEPPQAVAERPRYRWELRRSLLLDDGQDVPGRQDQVLLTLDLHLGAPVLGVEDTVPDVDVHGHPGPVLEPSGSDGHDFTLLGLLLGGVGDDDAGDRGLLFLRRLHHHAVVKRFQAEFPLGHDSSSSRLALSPFEC